MSLDHRYSVSHIFSSRESIHQERNHSAVLLLHKMCLLRSWNPAKSKQDFHQDTRSGVSDLQSRTE